MEVFKQIPFFADYEVSNFGRVKTISRNLRYTHAVTGEEHWRRSVERFLKVLYNNHTGYKFHQLYRDKKKHNCVVHRLVAEAFLPNPENNPQVNHKDGNKHNNTVDNLEWCTNEYNHKHAVSTGLIKRGAEVASSKLNDRMVHAIKWLLCKGFLHKDIANAFQVSRETVSLISEGKTWKHITLTELEIKP